jgi:uncharacterized membrane protein YgcG
MMLSVLVTGLLTIATAAAPAVTSGVHDGAEMFSAAAVKKAESKLQELQATRGWQVVFETVDSLSGKNIDQLSLEKARSRRVNGLYVLVVEEEQKLGIQSMGQPAARAFNSAVREELKRKMVAAFKAKDYDRGLLDGVSYVASVADKSPAPAAGKSAQKNTEAADGGRTLLTIVVIVAAVFVGVWIISRIFRRRPSARPEGVSAAEQAGAGRGFFGTMLAGLGGALLGSWLYDRFAGNSAQAAETDDVKPVPPHAEQTPDDHHESTTGDWSDTGEISDAELGEGGFGDGDFGGGDFGDGGFSGGEW